MKIPSFEMGKHGLHNYDKVFCIIILDVTKYILHCFDVEMQTNMFLKRFLDVKVSIVNPWLMHELSINYYY